MVTLRCISMYVSVLLSCIAMFMILDLQFNPYTPIRQLCRYTIHMYAIRYEFYEQAFKNIY